ncbi:5'-3' DNA helicase ZGRF1 [Discoglossus pictus]
MACQAFTVLYTHQKTKKAKVWQDGILKTLPEGRKATLYDDKGQRLESVFFKVDKLNPGDDLESDRYLITVEAEHVESSKSQKAIESKVAPNFNRNVPKSVGLRPPAGLKRKFTGFQCPREVSKKPLLEVDGMAKASSPVLAQSYSSLPSQLYTTSPLFAAPLTKQQEAVLLADSSVETWKNNYVTVQSPLPTTCLTSQKKTMETENMASTTHVGGGSITQNIRSTAQILALLKAQPLLLKNGVVCAEAGQQQYGQPCADSISQILKPTYTSVSENANTLNLNTHKTLQQPKESVSVKPVPKKSRWDVYLEQQPTSHTEDIENDSEDLSLITNAPDERHCSLTSLDFLSSNGNNQEEINVENDIKNSKYVDMPMETHESNASSGFLNRQLNKNLMLSNSHQLPEMPPMISTTPVVQTCGVEKPVTKYQRPQQFSFKPLQTITMSNMSENGTFQNKVADPNGFSTSEIHICNVVSSAQLFPKSDLVEDNPEQDKPIASDNPAVAELDELSSQNESKDEAFAEVTFNLLDSFEFADSDEEIPQGDILVPQSAPHLSKSCSDIDKNKSCAGDITVKKGKDQSNLGCYDSLHNENKSVPSKNIIVKEMESSLAVSNESDVVRTECQLRHVPLTSTNYTNSCSQGTRKVEHDSGFQTFGLVSNNVATTKNEQCATYLHAFKDCEFSSDIDILDDSELISSSLDVQETTEHIEQVSKKDDILLDNGEDFLENVQIGQKSLQTSNTPQQWSLPSSNDMFDCVAEESRSSPLSKQCDPDLEHDLQHLDEFVGSNESNTGSSEVSHSLSSISLLKTLTKPNTALESLNILNVKTHSAPQEREGAKPEPTSSEEEEGQPFSSSLELPIWAEGLNIAAVSKRFRLRASLEKRVPLVTGPEIPLCSNFSEENSAYSIQNTHQHSIPSMENNCGSPSKICPVIENREDYIFTEFIGEHSDSLDFIENASVSTHKRQSKWSKYQNTSDDFQNKEDRKEAEEFCAQSVFGKSHYAIEERQSNDMNISESEQLHSLKDTCGYEKSKDTVSRLKLLTKQLATVNTPLPHLGKPRLSSPVTEEGQQVLLSGDLRFPSRDTVLSVSSLKREVQIPTVFHSPAHYKQAFTAALTEHLNILMFDLSQRLHKAISKVDISFYTSSSIEVAKSNENVSPFCLHRQPAKLVMVKKEGQNKGRFFYTCDAPKSDQCKFFKWLEELKGTNPVQGKSEPKPVFGDVKSLASYVRCQKVPLYEESQLMIRKKCGFQKRRFGKFRKFADDDSEFGDSKTKLYLKLSRKEHSSTYSKDDIWVVSKTLIFDPQDTFIACSAFFGPSANNDIEILPLKGYYPSNWPSNMVVHALLVCNASTELTSLRNIQEHFNVATLPIMPYLLKMCAEPEKMNKVGRGKFNPPSSSVKVSPKSKLPSCDLTLGLAVQMIQQFSLNEHQAAALVQIAQMMSASEEPQEQQTLPVTIIHGVFGAGKSYLLAVVVLFLVQLFESIDVADGQHSTPWKLLISSSTNVAVDRVLLGLLDLGFDRFIRVGSVRKIAKPILPYSLHAGSDNDNEQLKELLALLKDDLTQAEKAYVRKSIEQHKLGTNKMLLGQVSVVGATCAACPFACLSNLKFPLVILDECSQMTEPASLLPIARFQCGKLILVGDPKQLSPSIQGSEAAHERGLEQTLFNRLCLMGHKTIMLRTQYRCHPVISAIANELFYEGHLLNGISEDDRRPLLDWLPTLCFYNVNGTEQMEGNNSFQNTEEAVFTMKLIQSLIASGVQGSMIGVITLYKSQMHKLCSLLASSELYDPMEVKAVQVSTVDAFQGAEKEIIVLSCVRTRQVGFIDSEKRMNVALTRGKRHLLIVGNLACLRKSTMWENVIHHCQKQTNGLKHVSQWNEELNNILIQYQEKKAEEKNTQRNISKQKNAR